MKIALYQMHIIWEDKEANYLKLENKLKILKEKNTELVFLPEMSFTGFSMNTGLTKESHSETLNRMADYARLYQLAIGFGWVKDCGERSENHYAVINKEGKILADYAKIHPFSFGGEDLKFQGGKNISHFELAGIPFAPFICYDLRFPEIFQIASKRAHVILVPANWPQKRRTHWKCLLQARAIENQVYIIAINCVGEIGGLAYSGDSCVIDPDGNVLLMASEKEVVLEYEHKDDVMAFRKNFCMKSDRNEQMYYELMVKNADKPADRHNAVRDGMK